MNRIEEHSVIFIEMEYGDRNDHKRRPAFIFKQGNKSVKVLKITTKYQGKSKHMQQFYFEINDWQQAGLHYPSWIDTYQSYELPNKKEMIIHILGNLSDADTERLLDFIEKRGHLA